MKYMIPAKPTEYRGRLYRSRLEARWAAFFDSLGWNFEYEPCDLGTWSPDFAVWGARRESAVLVEVKPLEGWDRIIGRKMADAAEPTFQNILLTLVEPVFSGPGTIAQIGTIGFHGMYEYDWSEALIGESDDGTAEIIPNADFHERGPIWLSDLSAFSPGDFQRQWIEAGNAVQWRKPARP